MGRATVYMRKKAPASPKHKYIPLLARFRAQGTVKPPRFKAHQPTGASCHTVNLASLCPNSPKQHSQPSSLLFLSLSPPPRAYLPPQTPSCYLSPVPPDLHLQPCPHPCAQVEEKPGANSHQGWFWFCKGIWTLVSQMY